jgi:hypothetical protein
MKKVTLTFLGDKTDEIAEKFFTWLVDGGFEDQLIEALSTDEIVVDGVFDYNKDTLDVTLKTSLRTP